MKETLARLEAAWIERGAPTTEYLVPGVEEREVRDRLANWPVLPDSVVEWFTWHNGSVRPSPAWMLAPSVWDLFSLDDVEREHSLAMEGSREIQSWGEKGFGWRDSWIPLMGIREDVLAVDCWTGEVLRGNLASPKKFGAVVAPTIESLVITWLEVLALDYGSYRWDPRGGWAYDWLSVPQVFKPRLT